MLRTRVITALFLVAGFALVLFALPPVAATLAFAAIAALAAWEWGGLMRQDQPARVMYAFVLLLFCWQITVAAPQLVPVLLTVSAAFWILVVPLWFRFKWTLAGNDFFGYLLGALVILPTWAAMAALHAMSAWLLLAAMALVWVADIAAYFTGRAFGRHKLAPAISPGKTWEGVAGCGDRRHDLRRDRAQLFASGRTRAAGCAIACTAIAAAHGGQRDGRPVRILAQTPGRHQGTAATCCLVTAACSIASTP
jgi:CDP-diglyceride synthetase